MEKFTRWGLIALLPILSFCGDDDGTTGTPEDMAMDMVMVDMADPDMGPDDMGPDDMGPDDMGPDDMGPDDMGPDMAGPILESIAADPADVTLNPGGTQALTITGTFSDASTMELTEGVNFMSSDDAVATVDAAGTITAVALGSATITADASGTTTTVDVFVARPDIVVFRDGFEAGINFVAFGGSANVIEPTMDMPFEGTMALGVSVPASGFTGGAYVSETPIDLSGHDALRFAVRSTNAGRTLNVAGLGNDQSPANPFLTEIQTVGGAPGPGVAVSMTWTEITIPIPDPARAGAITGVFHFAEAGNDGLGDGPGIVFFDNIRYVDLPDGAVSTPRSAIATEDNTIFVGDLAPINGESATLEVEGSDVFVAPAGIGFFEITSSMPAVASINAVGQIEALTPGMTEITTSLRGVASGGVTTITVEEPPVGSGPTMPAPTPPTRAAGDVISIYSDAYTSIAGVNFLEFGELNRDALATLEDELAVGDSARRYADAQFFGIRSGNQDASSMTHMHVDVWFEGMTGNRFTIRLVDAGADGTLGTGDDSFAELIFTPSGAPSPPALLTDQWQSFDIELSDFEAGGEVDVGALTGRTGLTQYIFGTTDPGGPMMRGTIWLDNIYFYRDPAP